MFSKSCNSSSHPVTPYFKINNPPSQGYLSFIFTRTSRLPLSTPIKVLKGGEVSVLNTQKSFNHGEQLVSLYHLNQHVTMLADKAKFDELNIRELKEMIGSLVNPNSHLTLEFIDKTNSILTRAFQTPHWSEYLDRVQIDFAVQQHPDPLTRETLERHNQICLPFKPGERLKTSYC